MLLELLDFRACLLDADARTEPAQHAQEVTASILAVRRDLQRCPQFRWVDFSRRKLKALRHYAYDRALTSVQLKIAAQDSGIGTKCALPQAIGHHGHLRSTLNVIRSCD